MQAVCPIAYLRDTSRLRTVIFDRLLRAELFTDVDVRM